MVPELGEPAPSSAVTLLQLAESPPVGEVESIGQRLVQAREQVAVAVKGDRDGRVPKPLLDCLGMGALGNQEGRARVA